jgi:hypothetical protein
VTAGSRTTGDSSPKYRLNSHAAKGNFLCKEKEEKVRNSL